ncbi:MAG: 3-dehydroquinate synthase [Planctomycetaceae bacterium]|jgi:3-dehydroquinate synthase|nr:3-dehydroquinate synthase [Planctomycetaceae bacterium]
MIVPVSLGSRSYDISVGSDCLQDAGTALAKFQPISSAVVLTDTDVQHFGYADRVADSIADAGLTVHQLTFESGEQTKSIAGIGKLWESLFDFGIDRKAVLVAVGGGVIGDFGGFAAATYARGIRFFQVPTTLLAQVDSSVGGKVGINLETGKNMVGAFHQPLGVLIDTATLQTLPAEQYTAGLGEVVKYALSLDASLFEFIESNTKRIKNRDNTVMQKIVAECCRIKAQIVTEDEHETKGRRILLNYGHTFAHAFESLSGYTMPHGLAVAMGSMCAARLAYRLGLVDEKFVQRQFDLYGELDLPTEYPSEFDKQRLIAVMLHDKKTAFGKLRFVLPTGLGQCRVVEDIDPQLLFESNV